QAHDDAAFASGEEVAQIFRKGRPAGSLAKALKEEEYAEYHSKGRSTHGNRRDHGTEHTNQNDAAGSEPITGDAAGELANRLGALGMAAGSLRARGSNMQGCLRKARGREIRMTNDERNPNDENPNRRIDFRD